MATRRWHCLSSTTCACHLAGRGTVRYTTVLACAHSQVQHVVLASRQYSARLELFSSLAREDGLGEVRSRQQRKQPMSTPDAAGYCNSIYAAFWDTM